MPFLGRWIQPDITAPGVNIIAAWPTPNGESVQYKPDTGTSMSCPHVSGIVALLKSVHPHWSPAAIRSALVTSGESKQKILIEYHTTNMLVKRRSYIYQII